MSESERGNAQQRQVGPYRLARSLGRGGMGEVYAAWDGRLQREVALKCLTTDRSSKSDQRRFLREARATARLSHPNVVRIHDFIEIDGQAWMVMERIDGTPLHRVLRGGALSIEALQRLALELADGLAMAHDEGILHRDLKPSNVMLTRDGQAKILDFGLARRIVVEGEVLSSVWLSNAPRSEAGLRLVGTPHAMSPEQARGEDLGPQADLFSLGILLYEASTGVSPFKGGTLAETLMRVCHLDPVPARRLNSEVSESFSTLLDHLLEKKPERRPASAHEIMPRLRQTTATGPVPDSPKLQPDFIEQITVVDEILPEVGGNTGEYRQVTVLSIEVAPSERLTQDTAAVYRQFEDLKSIVHTAGLDWEAHRTSQLAQRITLVFGYPRVREDEAMRSVLASQDIEERFRSWQQGLAETRRVHLRGALHTGPCLVLGRGNDKQLVLGETLDAVERLRRSAPWGHISVGGATARIVSRAFSMLPLEGEGEMTVEHLDDSACYRVKERRAKPSSWSEMGDSDAPLISRREELAILQERFEAGLAGPGSFVLVSGEAGIGKTRLLEAFQQSTRDVPGRRIRVHCSPQTHQSSLRPVEDLIRLLLDIETDETVPLSVDQLAHKLASLDLPGEPGCWLLAMLFGLDLSEQSGMPVLSPEKIRKQQLDLLTSIVIQCSRREALILMIEDLHWSDPSTLDWLGKLTLARKELRALVLLSARALTPATDQQIVATWTHLVLSPLLASEVDALLEGLTGGKAVPKEVRHLLAKRSDGIPLFVEELWRNLVESHQLVETEGGWELVAGLEEVRIPSTLQDSLAERLDRLGSTKRVAQLAAVIGREQSYVLLKDVAGDALTDLDAHLARLVRAEILYRRGYSRRARYRFRHALIRDAAYNSLVAERRRELHAVIARVLDTLFPEVARGRPEFVAHHLEGAGKNFEAAEYLQRAGTRAAKMSAYWEAVDLLRKGLALAEPLQESDAQQELVNSLYVSLAVPTAATSGFSEASTAEVYRRVHEIEETEGETHAQVRALYLEWSLVFMAGKVRQTDDVLEQIDQVYQRSQDLQAHYIANSCRGLTLFFRGNVGESSDFLELGTGNLERDSGRLSRAFATDPRFNAQVVWAWCRSLQGSHLEARDLIELGMDYAHALEDPFHIVTALAYRVQLYLHQRGRTAEALELGRRCKELATDHGLHLYVANSDVYLGWAHMLDGNVEGLTQLKRGMAAVRDMGVFAYDLSMQIWLTDGLLALGRPQEALEVIEQALKEQTREAAGCYVAEAHRLMALARHQLDGEGQQIEDLLRQSLEIARSSGAHLFELRTALQWTQRNSAMIGTLAEVFDPIYCQLSKHERFDPATMGGDSDLVLARDLLLRHGHVLPDGALQAAV